MNPLATQKQTIPAKSTPNHNAPLIPRPTDARAELFYLCGRISGQGVEGANRIAELVIELTSSPAPVAEAEGE